LYPAKQSFKINRDIKTFQDKQKLKQLVTIVSALQKILNEILLRNEEERHSQGLGSRKNKFLEKNKQGLGKNQTLPILLSTKPLR
jgi:hypothetical protein